MKIGSLSHCELFCRSFMDAHVSYGPEELPWPELDSRAIATLRSLPVFSTGLHDEEAAGRLLRALAQTAPNPLLREAFAMQAFEEERHARILRHMLNRYGIVVEELPAAALPKNLEGAYLRFGFGEAVDTFLGGGLHEVARRSPGSGSPILPVELVAIFDRLLDEEAQHIAFFYNWQVFYYGGARTLRTKVWNPAAGYGYGFARLLRMVPAARIASQHEGAGELLANVRPSEFLHACVDAYERRMEQVPGELLKPTMLPRASRMFLSSLRWLAGAHDDEPEGSVERSLASRSRSS